MNWKWIPILAVIFCNTLLAEDEERKLEAIFLGRFASFIEWPVKTKPKFQITLIDENPFGTILDELYKDKKIHNKPIEIKVVTKIEDIGQCDILFVVLDTAKARRAAIEYAQKNSILTISESKGFAESGGIIQLNFVNQKTQIKINHDAAVKSNIKIDAPLLNVATVLKGGKQ